MSGARFVVSRVNWRRSGDGWVRLPGEIPLGSFPTLEAATADRNQREGAARAAVNPFRCGGPAVHYWTSLDEPRLRDWLMDRDLTPPADGDWPRWWDETTLSESQTTGVWAALDRLTFFTVTERPAGPVGYAVVRVNWEYDDEHYYSLPEGGTVLTVYRDRRKAAAVCREQNAVARQEWAEVFAEDGLDDEDGQFDDSNRAVAAADPFGPPVSPHRYENLKRTDEVPFFEVVEIELEGRS